MKNKIKCDNDNCLYNSYGDCEAENVEIQLEPSEDGFVSVCETYEENEEE